MIKKILFTLVFACTLFYATPSSAMQAQCKARCDWDYNDCMWSCRDWCDEPTPHWCLDRNCAQVCSNVWWECVDNCTEQCPWYCGYYCCWMTEAECNVPNPPAACFQDCNTCG